MGAWKKIRGYAGVYEVSAAGKVRSTNYNHTGKTKILKPGICRGDYQQVWLCKNGKYKMFYIHVLVAKYFIGPRPKGKEVNHKKGKKNNVENLEYLTHSENVKYTIKMRGGPNNAILSYAKAKQIRKLYKLGATAADLSLKFRVITKQIKNVINNRSWKK